MAYKFSFFRDLVSFDLAGALDSVDSVRKLKDFNSKQRKHSNAESQCFGEDFPGRSSRKMRERDDEPVPGSSKQNRR